MNKFTRFRHQYFIHGMFFMLFANGCGSDCASLLLLVNRSIDAFEAFVSSLSSFSLAPCSVRYFFAMASQSVTVSIRFDKLAKLICDPYGLKCTTLTDIDSTQHVQSMLEYNIIIPYHLILAI